MSSSFFNIWIIPKPTRPFTRPTNLLRSGRTTIQSRLQWQSKHYDCTPLERLSAEQHCEIVIAADEYYRKCVSEPSGSQASWNARKVFIIKKFSLENPKHKLLLNTYTNIFILFILNILFIRHLLYRHLLNILHSFI